MAFAGIHHRLLESPSSWAGIRTRSTQPDNRRRASPLQSDTPAVRTPQHHRTTARPPHPEAHLAGAAFGKGMHVELAKSKS